MTQKNGNWVYKKPEGSEASLMDKPCWQNAAGGLFNWSPKATASTYRYCMPPNSSSTP